MIPGSVSGKIEMAIGYRKSFVWVLIPSVPALVLSRFIPIERRAAQTAPDSEAQPARV
jgi:PAT family beta-lactamase induction signal transducer AmpG